MIRILIIICINTLSISLCISQEMEDMFTALNNGYKNRYEGEYNSAITNFNKVSQLQRDFNWLERYTDKIMLLQLSGSYACIGEDSIGLYYLEKAIESDFVELELIMEDSCIQTMRKNKKWNNILSKARKKNTKFKQIREDLLTIKIKDQFLRKLLPCVESEYALNSKEYGMYWELIKEQDSINLVVITELIKKHGWLGKSEIGSEANQAQWYVIQHTSSLEEQKKYIPMIKSSVLKGETVGSNLAFLIDRILLKEGKKQLYGSQIHKDPETGELSLNPIEDIENLNMRRAELKMEPYEIYLSKLGLSSSSKIKK